MVQLGRFFAEMGWPLNFLIMAVFLGLVWLLTRLFKNLRPFTGQLLVLAGIFWVGLLFFIISYSFPLPSPILRAVTNASTIPRVWFYALVPSVALALIPLIRGKSDPDPKWGGNIRHLLIVIAILVFNVILIPYIGYYICSAATIFAIMWMLDERNKFQLVAVPLGWAAFSYLVFARLLDVRLPVGSIFSIFAS